MLNFLITNPFILMFFCYGLVSLISDMYVKYRLLKLPKDYAEKHIQSCMTDGKITYIDVRNLSRWECIALLEYVKQRIQK